MEHPTPHLEEVGDILGILLDDLLDLLDLVHHHPENSLETWTISRHIIQYKG